MIGRRLALLDRLSQVGGAAFVVLAALFMLIPALLVAVLSFSGDTFFVFPPKSWGLRQYDTLIHDDTWRHAVWLSFKIAVPVAVLSALLVVPTVLVLYRSRLIGRHAVAVVGLSGIIVPISAFAVALYGVFAQFGLLGTYGGLVMANTTLGIPVMLLVAGGAMARIPVELELAAMVAGASRARAWMGITLRLLLPSVVAGGVLAFVTSFDEAVFINFLGGPGKETLPKAILDSVRFGLDPVITAIATCLMVATSLIMLAVARLSGRQG